MWYLSRGLEEFETRAARGTKVTKPANVRTVRAGNNDGPAAGVRGDGPVGADAAFGAGASAVPMLAGRSHDVSCVMELK